VIISCTIVTHSGKFGVVYRATLSRWKEYEQEVIAVKTLKGKKQWVGIHNYTHLLYLAGNFDQTEIDKIVEESLKMRKFKHPHVMGLIGVWCQY